MPVLALLFLVVPLLELYVIVQVAQVIGVVETLALLVVMSVLGAWLVKRQGIAIWRRFNSTLRNGQVPHREIVDGALVLFAGALLLTPGFTSDVLGLLLLLPPTRAIVRSALISRITAVRVIDSAASRFPFSGRDRAADTRDVWEAESWETPAGDGDPDDPTGRGGELGR
ncbi:FxsA family protein [Actinomarinicola tropica]|uniref:FxsA family protein n=1 Tax=Actinomarinicola tropica TaxID=2789776 RepID=A0A5Q2RI57_9ACTN|nr:FxsA family protein [Actinomarinicola tropica]QGG96548.1 FxsA family protein [Actinomarinicola tropica]